jgi:hypothetical protein
MKRFALLACSLATALLVPGCPIYGEDEGCAQDSDCPETYQCDGLTGLCSPEVTRICSTPSECSASETCGSDGLCHAGDCSWPEIGCIVGYSCSSASGVFHCVEGDGSGGAGGQGNDGGTAGVGGST